MRTGHLSDAVVFKPGLDGFEIAGRHSGKPGKRFIHVRSGKISRHPGTVG